MRISDWSSDVCSSDLGDYRIDGESRLLEPGMVFTIEPGLYIAPDDTTVAAKWRGIGIRTEDDALVTRDGSKVLTGKLARSADAIEALMAPSERASRAIRPRTPRASGCSDRPPCHTRCPRCAYRPQARRLPPCPLPPPPRAR